MKIELAPGETLVVSLKDSDGTFTVKFGESAVTVEADMPDTKGREGVIYEEAFRSWEEFPCPTDVTDVVTKIPTLEMRGKPRKFALYPKDKEKLLQCLATHSPLAVTAESIKDETTFIDLGFDSMDVEDVRLDLEETFSIELPDSDSFASVRELENKIAERLLNAKR